MPHTGVSLHKHSACRLKMTLSRLSSLIRSNTLSAIEAGPCGPHTTPQVYREYLSRLLLKKSTIEKDPDAGTALPGQDNRLQPHRQKPLYSILNIRKRYLCISITVCIGRTMYTSLQAMVRNLYE